MPRLPSSVPTEVELAILGVIWARGEGTVREVHEPLSGAREMGYSTTLKMMQVMTEKGLLVKDDSRKPQVYRAAEGREETEGEMVEDLIRKCFGGSAMRLVMRAVSGARMSREERAAIRKALEQAKEKR